MLSYIILICASDLLIFVLNFFFHVPEFDLGMLILVAALQPVILIAIDGAAAAAVRRLLPEKWFDYKSSLHHVSDAECRFYEKIGIRKWKDHVVELGMFTAFSKKSVASPRSPEYVERFILECNYGVWCHILGIVLGFLLLVIFPREYMLTVTLPAALVNAVLSVLPVFILRYNVPRLTRLHASLSRRS
jgi:hypothetical protein